MLHPAWKWPYLEKEWRDSPARITTKAKADLRRLWENSYKGEELVQRPTSQGSRGSPEHQHSYIESVMMMMMILIYVQQVDQ